MADDILIVDDESDIRALISGILQDEGCTTRQSATTHAAWEEIATRVPGLLILDIWLEGSQEDGIMFLKRVKNTYPDLPVVMISGHGNIETAVQAIQLGAYDFIEKPFNADRLLLTIQRAMQNSRLARENMELRRRTAMTSQLIGKSHAVQALTENLNKVAATNSRILITGAAGAGKEVAARYIHQHSKRHNQPFILLNCATLRAQDLEEELFGWENKTTNGGANNDRKIGLLEQAHGGTLLLDEIADMPLETQAKMVRVLQDNRFERLGSHRPVEVDIRYMATSNRDLKQLLEAGRLRQDLYYRLNVVPVSVPTLRDRLDDIPLLVNHFIEQISLAGGLKPRQLGSDALAVLQAYPWQGNIRQLRNLIEWLLIMLPATEGHTTIRANDLPVEFRNSAPAVTHLNRADEMMQLPLREAREIFEREYLLAQIARFGGNISRTASFVEMERSALHRKLKLLDIASNKPDEEIAA
jgi:two-component system, NtrC family, nitrogen regulation response regulator NtrX